ncbi:MAG TPA: cation diffusion facilitator family transporter, partial [Acidimicrobiales bacterium]|nr:cation diffusion facilitator family transporter [Acidimicrobiales bacterium]
MATAGSRAVLTALLANLGIAVAKFAGFLTTRSTSMLVESIHSATDSTNQLLLLLGARRANRPPSPMHPFGYGRERYFWSFIVALVLFSAGAAFAIYQGIAKIRTPHDLDNAGWAICILLVGIILETYSLR